MASLKRDISNRAKNLYTVYELDDEWKICKKISYYKNVLGWNLSVHLTKVALELFMIYICLLYVWYAVLLQISLSDQCFSRNSLDFRASWLKDCHVLVGEKLPWTAKLENLTVYTTHRSEQVLYLLKPTSLCATLAVTTKYRCLQTDNLTDSLSLLGLCIHADMQMVEMAISNPQVCHCYLFSFTCNWLVFSGCELAFTFAICYRRSVGLFVCRLSVTLVRPTQPVEIFRNFFSPYDNPGTLLFWCQKSLVGTPLSP